MTRAGMAVALVALAAGVAEARDVKLPEVLARSEVAVLVELGKPAMQKVAFPVPDGPQGKHCGRYDFGALRATVVKVLAPRQDAPLTVGQSLLIVPADTEMLIDLTHEACAGGGDKELDYERFKGEDAQQGGVKLIALLRWQPGYGWAESVSGSWLSPKLAARLSKLGGRHSGEADAAGNGICLADSDCRYVQTECGACSCPGPPSSMSRDAAARVLAKCAATTRASAGSPAPHCPACPPPMPPPKVIPPARCQAMRCVAR